MKIFKYLLPCFLALLPAISQAQIIEKLEGQLKSLGGGDNNANFDSEYFWLDLLINIGYYPTWGLLFGFDNELRPNAIDFNPYPYADGRSGLYLPQYEEGRLIRTQVVAHVQTNEDALYGGFFQVKFSPNRALTIDVNRLQLFEQLENGGNDRFSITSFNLQFNRIRHDKFNLWWGGGLMLLDGELLYGSPSMSIGFNWFFKKPLSLYADTQFGFPNGTYARQHQARMQMHLGRYMVYAGYQGLRIGSERVPGWTMGTGVWF